MMQRMEKYALERYGTRLNEWNEEIREWKSVGEISAAVSVITGSTQELNQVLQIKSTHKALTPDDVRAGDRFGGYTVDYMIPGRTYRQLYLSRTEAIHEGQD